MASKFDLNESNVIFNKGLKVVVFYQAGILCCPDPKITRLQNDPASKAPRCTVAMKKPLHAISSQQSKFIAESLHKYARGGSGYRPIPEAMTC